MVRYVVVCYQRGSTCLRVTIFSARSVRSFFSVCDRASTRPFVDARGPLCLSALGPLRPTPIKSMRSSCGTPRRSIIRNTPGRDDQVQGTARAGREPQGFAAGRRRINTVTGSKWFSLLLGSGMLHFSNLGGGQGYGGNRPERRARARRGMRAGRSVRPCSFLVPRLRHSSLSFPR
jgi:hypothetical protein